LFKNKGKETNTTQTNFPYFKFASMFCKELVLEGKPVPVYYLWCSVLLINSISFFLYFTFRK